MGLRTDVTIESQGLRNMAVPIEHLIRIVNVRSLGKIFMAQEPTIGMREESLTEIVSTTTITILARGIQHLELQKTAPVDLRETRVVLHGNPNTMRDP